MPARTRFRCNGQDKGPNRQASKREGGRSLPRESRRQQAVRAGKLCVRLAEHYGRIDCPLSHSNTFELLVAVILSAQCTDAAVNQVTPALFHRYPTPQALARAEIAEIESYVRRLGLYRTKAKALKGCAIQLVNDFRGAVPSAMEDLMRLAGVGRKTANVIRGHAFGIPGISVDTHCKRLARRLGLSREQDPSKIERDLSGIFPPKEWTSFSHRLILHGRRICHARKPACASCFLADLCPSRLDRGRPELDLVKST